MKKRFICTAPLNHYRKPSCRWEKIDDKGWIDGETPIEDLGMFLILEEEISPASAEKLFFALLQMDESADRSYTEKLDEEETRILFSLIKDEV